MFNRTRLRIASAMARFASLFGQAVGPEIQRSAEAVKAPRFQMAPRRTRGRIFWESWQKGTYVRLTGDAKDDARKLRFQRVCNFHRQRRLEAMRVRAVA